MGGKRWQKPIKVYGLPIKLYGYGLLVRILGKKLCAALNFKLSIEIGRMKIESSPADFEFNHNLFYRHFGKQKSVDLFLTGC